MSRYGCVSEVPSITDPVVVLANPAASLLRTEGGGIWENFDENFVRELKYYKRPGMSILSRCERRCLGRLEVWARLRLTYE